MDSERRHQLRENDLAHILTVTRDYFEKYSKQITLLALTALVMFAIGSFVVRSRAAAHEDIWRQKNELQFEGTKEGLRDVDRLFDIVGESTDRGFIMEGLIEAGRQSLRLANQAAFPPDRELNSRARRAFEELMKRFPGEPLPTGIALSGLATTEENDFVWDYNLAHKEKTREYLTRLSTDALFAGLPFQRMALDRLKILDSVFQVTVFEPPLPPPPPEVSETDEVDVDFDQVEVEPGEQP